MHVLNNNIPAHQHFLSDLSPSNATPTFYNNIYTTCVLIIMIFQLNVVTFYSIENRAILGPC